MVSDLWGFFYRRGSVCVVCFSMPSAFSGCCLGCARRGRGQSGAARQGRQVALLGLASASANGSAEGQCPRPLEWAVQRGHSCQTQPVPLPSPGCRSRKFRVNYRVQKSIVEGDRSGAGSDRCQPLPAQASSCPFHFGLL